MEHFKRDKTFFVQLLLNSVGFFTIFATLIFTIMIFANDFKIGLGTLVLVICFSIFLSFIVLIGTKKLEHSRIVSIIVVLISCGMLFNTRSIYFLNLILSSDNIKFIGILLLCLYVLNFGYFCFKIEKEKDFEKIRPYHNDEGLKLNRD